MEQNLKLLSELPRIDAASHADKLIAARAAIGELKGACYGLPNPQLLLSPTIMREALESSEIENIVTTLEDVLQAQLFSEKEQSPADKEVLRYNKALEAGINSMKNSYLGENTIKDIHAVLIPTEPDVRRTQNALRNAVTGEVVYMPPSAESLPRYLSDLEKFINSGDGKLDPVLKTIIAHYQFEAIHPFGDGNGRTGRILMVLCMLNYGLLDLPVLFISEYINNNKAGYYSAFKKADDTGELNGFIDYMLDAFTMQAQKSTTVLLGIRKLHEDTKRYVREQLPNIYSRDLIDAIFSQPLMTATRYEEIMRCSYPTASSHLKLLEEKGILRSVKIGKYLIFANIKLMEFLRDNPAFGSNGNIGKQI